MKVIVRFGPEEDETDGRRKIDGWNDEDPGVKLERDLPLDLSRDLTLDLRRERQHEL
jgi:hypothetical protein